jgi:hypothetical protein
MKILSSLLGIDATFSGTLNLTSLSGVGNRMLIVNSTGTVSTQTIPTGTVTSVTATSPITSTGGTTPVISTSMSTNRLIGRSTAGSGIMEEISLGSGLSLSGGTLSASTLPSSILHAIASGTDTYTVTIPGVTSYADGDVYLINFTNGNTTSATLNINGLGAIALWRNNDGALIGGDIVSGGEILCVYNAATTAFQCIGTAPNTLLAYVTNAEATTITRGQAVYVFGGTGDRITVKLAYNTTDATSAQTIGIVQSVSIAANQKGLIIVQGQLDGLSLFPTATWADGDFVYLGATPGSVTNVKPIAPNHLVYLGYVTTASNGAAGRMYVKVQNGYEMNEIHDVYINPTTLANNDLLQYDSATDLWLNKSLSAAGIQPTLTLTTTGTSGAATLVGATLNIPQYQSVITNPVTGTGTSGQVAYFNGTNSITSNASFAFTPTSELLVNNSVTAASAIARGTNLTPTLTAAANNDLLVGLDVNSTFTNGAFTGVSNIGIRVSNSILIGSTLLSTNTTAFPLQVNLTNASSNVGAIWRNAASSGYTSFRFYNDQNSGSRALEMGYSGSAYIGSIISGGIAGESAYMSSTGSYPLQFGTNNTTRAIITSGGNVLIGTATDGGQKLQVVGDTKITGATSAGNYSLSVYNSSNAISFYVRGFGDALLAGTLFLGTQNGPNFISNGTLGITSSQGAGNQFVRFTHNNGNNAIRILSNSVVELNPVAGNVLIGTTTDAGFKLDVNGTTRSQGKLTITTGGAEITGTAVLYSGAQSYGQVQIFSAAAFQMFNAANNSKASFQYINGNGLSLNTNSENLSGVLKGLQLSHTMVANANGVTLVGLDITPTFTNGAFTGVTNWGFRLNSGASSFGGDVALNGNRLYIGSIFGNTVLRPVSTTSLQLFNSNAGATLFLDANGAVQIGQSTAVYWANFSATGHTIYNTTNTNFYSNGNVGIATASDSGQKLQVNGTALISSLGGGGTQMVVADNTGVLSTQAIPIIPTKSFGAFQEDTTQVATASNIGYGIKFTIPDISGHGVTMVNDPFGDRTYIEMANAGFYNIQFSCQFQNIDNKLHDVTIWLRKNGNNPSDDIPATAGFISVPNSHGGTPGHCIVAWNYFVEASSGDFFQLVWSTTSHPNVTMEFYPAGSPPPSAASAILTVNQVD